MAKNPLLRELEEIIVDAWPAADTAELHGWLARVSGGPSHRGNSVSTLDSDESLPLDERVAEVEAWYAARGAKATFQLGPCVQPKELEACLITRGYVKEGATAVASADPDEVEARTRTSLVTRLTAKPEPAWLEMVARASRFGKDMPSFQGFLKRLGSRCRFALALDQDGSPLASCLGIASEDRLGVYAMLTLPEARRRGAARALLHVLAESAQRERMRAMYLMVELDNAPARALYKASGFTDVYEYSYRTQSRAED